MDRTIGKSQKRNNDGERLMKILRSYKDMMKEFINEDEVDDDKVIKYKKKDGEQGEMKASSAKTMEKDHPAKIAYDKMKGDDGGDDSEKDSGDKLGDGDFDRDGGGEPEDDEPDTDDIPSDSPEARLEKIDSEIADIEKQREILKQYMTSSGGGGVSSSRIDQLEKEDKELVAKWRELKQARMDLDGPVYGEDATEEQEELISINGKKYRPIKESKKPNKRVLKENYDRIFGEKD